MIRLMTLSLLLSASGMAALLGGAETAAERAQRLLAACAAEATTATTLAERWPAMTRLLDQRGPRTDVEPWHPVCDIVVQGQVRYVHPDLGDDAHDGLAPGSAFRSLERALAVLQPGDALLLGPGTYYTPGVTVQGVAGTAERPVYMRAEPRGAATMSSAWPDAAEGLVRWQDEGEGLWSAPFPSRVAEGKVDRRAMGGYRAADGSVYFLFGMRSLADLLSPAVRLTWDAYSQTRPMPWPGYGFALEGGRAWLRTPGGEDPNGRPVIVSTYLTSESSLLQLQASTHVIIDGLRFEGAGDKALRSWRDSPYTVVRNCIAEWCRTGFAPDDHALVEWSEYVFPGYKRFADDLKRLQLEHGIHVLNPLFGFVKKYHGAGTEGHLTARPWTAPKENRGVGPLHCVARYNRVHGTFDGQSLGGWSESESHHNVFIYQFDNAVEFEAGAPSQSRNNHFHHNLIIGAQYGAVSHQDVTTEPMGPQWVYRNVIIGNFPAGYQGPGFEVHGGVDSAEDAWRPWVVSKFLAPNANAITYDHNLIWMRAGNLLWVKEETADSRSRMAWRNNVVVFEDFSGTPQPMGTRNRANTWVGPQAWSEFQGEGGQHLAALADLRLVDVAALDFRPLPDSPLVAHGQVIDGPAAGAGNGLDIGPFAAGAALELVGGAWPRPLGRVFNTAPPKAFTGRDEIMIHIPASTR